MAGLWQALALPPRFSRWLYAAAYGFTFAVLPVFFLLVSGCENVQGFKQQAMVRFIDASYNAPAVDLTVEDQLIDANIAQGTVTNYALMPPNTQAKIVVTQDGDSSATPLVATYGTLKGGSEYSVFLTDYNSTYQVTMLEDQSTSAPSGHSQFRFLNQAPATGPVDVYLIPTSSTFANAKPVSSSLAVGASTGYITVTSQNLNLVIVPAGTTSTTYSTTTSSTTALSLTGGEVRTVLVVDSQLTKVPPNVVIVSDDVN